jgi:hypothetical protein
MKVSAFVLSGWLGLVSWLQAWVQVVGSGGFEGVLNDFSNRC